MIEYSTNWEEIIMFWVSFTIPCIIIAFIISYFSMWGLKNTVKAVVVSVIISTASMFLIGDSFSQGIHIANANSPFRLLEGEVYTEDTFIIRYNKMMYAYGENKEYELGDITIDGNNLATFEPTTPLGVTFSRYGRYVMDNPELEAEMVHHKINLGRESWIRMIMYEDNFSTSEVKDFTNTQS